MNSQLGVQLTELSDIIASVTDDQRDTQRNLHNTMAAAQTMAKDAESIQFSVAKIADQVHQLSESLKAYEENRQQTLAGAEKATGELITQIEALKRALRCMEQATNSYADELNAASTMSIEE